MEDVVDHLLKPIAYRRPKRKASTMANLLGDDMDTPIAHMLSETEGGDELL